MDTDNMPEFTDLENGILFGVELKVGYVLEFNNYANDIAVVIPTVKGLAVSYMGGGWEYLVHINPNTVETIRGIINNDSLIQGELLWSKQ